jgi:TetR/AcrR family transcriptional repressor of nem operon
VSTIVVSSLLAALSRAAARHEIDAATLEDRARLIQAGVFGALVAARAGAGDEALATIDALEREIQRWRTTAATAASR